MTDHYPVPVRVYVFDTETGEETAEVQLRCGCEDGWHHMFGEGEHQ